MAKMTEDELKAVLCALERRGMIESRIDADGEVRWRTTAKGETGRHSNNTYWALAARARPRPGTNARQRR
jgi:hypothetical protein